MGAGGLRRDVRRTGQLARGQGTAIEKRRHHRRSRRVSDERRDLGDDRACNHSPKVESLEAIAERLTTAGSRRRHDVEQALGVGPGTEGNVEVKWTGADGVMLDVSKTGWLGTPTFGH